MTTSRTNTKDSVVTLRVPRSLNAAVKSIADREAETSATIWRRLVRRGLELERRSSDGHEAA